MSGESPYQIPGFLSHSINNGQPFSEKDEQAITRIFEATDRFQYPDAGTARNWEAFKNRIEPVMVVTKKPARKFAVYKWAAAAVVVLGLCIGLWQYRSGAAQTFTANYITDGTPQSITLPDQSRIKLNAHSELQVTSLNDKERTLRLVSGEAYFEVTHNELPFIVETPKGTVLVMGTEFNVRSVDGSPFSVALKSGKICFRNAESSVELKPGQCIKEKNGALVVGTVDVASQFPFRDDNMVFDGTALSEIVKQLESHYNVKFVYEHKMDAEKVKITFKDNMSATEAAELLSATIGSKVTIE